MKKYSLKDRELQAAIEALFSKFTEALQESCNEKYADDARCINVWHKNVPWGVHHPEGRHRRD